MNRENQKKNLVKWNKAQATKSNKKDVYEISVGAGRIMIYAEGPMASQFRIFFLCCPVNLLWSVFTSLCVLAAQLCLTLCDPMDYSPLGSFVHGILQARVLEWVAISFSTELL